MARTRTHVPAALAALALLGVAQVALGSFVFRHQLDLPDPTPRGGHRGVFASHGMGAGPGDALFLSPIIESGNPGAAEEAQRLARVELPGFNATSYSGYITVNREYNSNLFFWYFPAEENVEEAPLVLWLQGGPGSTSMFGLFGEHGPITVDKNGHMARRSPGTYWSRKFSVLYIDSPVGTGWSFTGKSDGYATDQMDVGRDLYLFTLQFLRIFPKLQSRHLYIAGESYAGKYVPALARAIHDNNPAAELKVNLKGLFLGNAWTDPRQQTQGQAEHMFQLGLIDTRVRSRMRNVEDEVVKLIDQEKFVEANEASEKSMGGPDSLFGAHTGFSNVYNFLHSEEHKDKSGDYHAFMTQPWVRRAIHVGFRTWHGENSETVYEKLIPDKMQSMAPVVADLLEHYRVLFYYGQLDIICAYPMAVNFFQSLQWSGAEEYKKAARVKWRVKGHLAGYAKTAARGRFTEVLVRNAGHMVPAEQPEWTLNLLERFVSHKVFA